ncbi:helix-turn-helix transcriptional regulator [Clostridium tagluense]|uniref:helix-turn-helix transcriptional regulator n=1 Tax=Clostridium tagluense TaxID=360422 RepID=UPI001C6F128B|nr:helix-turn-helix transcriptional regulator [Clostridium tagluense]MBW9159351.1 helix-turn-helix transcriptional regulator [Clostridium tagluense]WLC68074.1 helix-turn-helix transcriptional regulator [Clostridium tagluense]
MRVKLKELRKNLGYTQKEFASELGISKRTYESIEQGLRFPGQSNMIKIMKKLNIDSIGILDDIQNKKITKL